MYNFRKEERLCSKRDIEHLFKQGKSFKSGIFRVVWLFSENVEGQPCRVLFSVSRRNLKKAVDRNTTKRRMREAYRLNKTALCESLQLKNLSLNFAIIYNGREVPSFGDVEHKIILILHRLILNHEESSG